MAQPQSVALSSFVSKDARALPALKSFWHLGPYKIYSSVVNSVLPKYDFK